VPVKPNKLARVKGIVENARGDRTQPCSNCLRLCIMLPATAELGEHKKRPRVKALTLPSPRIAGGLDEQGHAGRSQERPQRRPDESVENARGDRTL